MKRVVWSRLDPRERTALLRRPTQVTAPQTRAAVQRIVTQVRAGGDEALFALGEQFDGVKLDTLQVGDAEFAAAAAAVPEALRAAIDAAAERIERFHAAGLPQGYAVDTADGVRCERLHRPIRSVGLYVPAGSAPLPSTARGYRASAR